MVCLLANLHTNLFSSIEKYFAIRHSHKNPSISLFRIHTIAENTILEHNKSSLTIKQQSKNRQAPNEQYHHCHRHQLPINPKVASKWQKTSHFESSKLLWFISNGFTNILRCFVKLWLINSYGMALVCVCFSFVLL